MKIALVRPNYKTHLVTPPLGIGSISSYLQQQNHEVYIIDALNKNLSIKEVVEKCRKVDIVGISCMSAYFLEVIALSKALKAEGIKVVVGGPHASALSKLTLEKTGADFVIIGEGEESFAKLLDALKKKKKIGPIIKQPLIKDLDSLPFPDWKQMNPRIYKKAPHGALIKHFPVAPIITTRGCPFECTFCASPKLWGRKIRYRSPANVVEEIDFLVKNFGVREIHFEDDNLTLKRQHIEEICHLIIRKNIKISWACPNGVRADTIDEELLKLMKKSGCYYLAFGFESGNQEILDNVKKRTTLNTLRKAVTLASKIGIMTQGFFIFGLPGETKETIKNTIEFAKSTHLERAQFLLLDVLPGSELWDKLDFEKIVDWTKESFHEATWVPPTIDKRTLEEAAPRAFKSFFFRLRPMLCLVKYFKPAQLPFIIRRILDFKIFGGN